MSQDRSIPLFGLKAAGRTALISEEDYDRVSRYRWHVHQIAFPGQRDHGPYAFANARRDGKRTRIYMHGLITGYPATDHINHDGLDNRRINLRPAGNRNQHNTRANILTTSNFKGVHWDRARSRWRAAISAGGAYRYLGRFESEVDAARAYDAAAHFYFGEYACLNFPEGGGA